MPKHPGAHLRFKCETVLVNKIFCFRQNKFALVPSGEDSICKTLFHSLPCKCTFLFPLKGKCHKMHIFLGLNISTFCCVNGFHALSKAFHYPIQLLTFYKLYWNYLLILMMLTETRLRIPFSVIGRCYLVPASHGLEGKCARIKTFDRQFLVWFYRIKGGFL